MITEDPNDGPDCEYFNWNITQDYHYDTEYNGFSDVFTLEALNLGSGIHHMKIVIADAADGHTDSAIFLQTNSLSATPVQYNIPLPTTLLLFGLGNIFRRKHEMVERFSNE